MRSKNHKSVLMHAGLAASILLLASGATFAQQQVNLSAGVAAAIMPTHTVPMWGYSCDATQVAGSTRAAPRSFRRWRPERHRRGPGPRS